MSDRKPDDLPPEGEFAVDLDAAAALIKQAFPDIRCLRCGHDSFVLADPPVYTNRLLGEERRIGPIVFFPRPKAVELVCNRCGMTETHALKYLEEADKPIRTKDG